VSLLMLEHEVHPTMHSCTKGSVILITIEKKEN
jgi:hypothetical protein